MLYHSMKKNNSSFVCVLLFWGCILAACNNNNTSENSNEEENTTVTSDPALISYNVVNVFPHDTQSFTEGLLIHEGKMYESTGSPDAPANNGSWLGIIDMKTGKIDKKVSLASNYFGEGITLFKDHIYQLTWQNQKGFVYDARTFKQIKEFSYTGEGWSLTHDSAYLIMSDGTNKLRYLDPATLKVVKIMGVEDNNGPVSNVNELEYIAGYIYANQWLTNYILKIDPTSGKVVGKLDLKDLAAQAKSKFTGSSELNGIAYDPANGKIYVTGKCWPVLYEIRLN